MIIPSFPASGTEVHAAEVSDGAPGHFATKEQLLTFNTDDRDGKNPAKVYFGNNNQEWWIAGREELDCVTLFAASPLATEVQFDDSVYSKAYSEEWGCTYSGDAPSTVRESHYGGSTIRERLKELETFYFSAAERNLMRSTLVYTNDRGNDDRVYSTADTLYLAYANQNDTYITVGENSSDDLNNGLRIDREYWWGKNFFWLRAPSSNGYDKILMAAASSLPDGSETGVSYAVVPAFKLNLSSVLFASAVKASSEHEESGTIEDNAAMALRLDGSNKKIGTVTYDAGAGKIEAQKDDAAEGTVSLVVQGNNGTNDWYYSVPAGEGNTVITKGQIQDACSLSGIDLTECKIWLETTKDHLTYAKMADTGQGRYATAKQLRGFNTDDRDGKNSAKIRFGKTDGNDQEWWIAGSQSGNSVTLFAASPLATGQKFDPQRETDLTTNTVPKPYPANGNCTYPDGTDIESVFVNHYGASSVRDLLKGLETSNFSTAEQALMQTTTVYTKDIKNKVVYSTTDKLYLAYGNGYRTSTSYITVGTNSSDELGSGLYIDKEYRGSDTFWLRNPRETAWINSTDVMVIQDGSSVAANIYSLENALVPAFELDLSSVLMASAAKAASSERGESGTIEDDTAMTLRLDGSDKKIGTAIYDSEAGKIVARKDEGAGGTVSLVVQGNDGTNDWYYSVPAGEITIVSKEQIQETCNISGEIDLAECKIWLETTTDGMSYAKMADAKNLNAAVILEPGQTVVRVDETIKNSQDGTVTVDKEHDGTVDVTITLPQAGNVSIAADGRITVPVGGKVQAAGGKELTLPNGGTVDTDGNIEAGKIISGNTTVSASDGKKVTADKTGIVTVPAGGKVQIGDGNELTLPDGGSVDKDGKAEAGKIISGDITITAPEGEKVTADKDGNITIPAGGKIQIGGGNELTLSNGGIVDADGNIKAEKIISGDMSITAPEGEKVTADKDGNIMIPAGGKVQIGGGKELTLLTGGTADKDGNITIPAGGKVQIGDGNELTLPNGGTVDKVGNVKAEKIISGDITVTAPEGGKITADKTGDMIVPSGGTVQTGDGKELTLPIGGTVDKDGNVKNATPSCFLTKEKLKTFNTDDTDVYGKNSAKIRFGEGENASHNWCYLSWWIAGNQGDDSVTLFARTPLAWNQQFDPNYKDGDNRTKAYNTDWGCNYLDRAPSEVYVNHYGGSPLRSALKELETSCFTSAEQKLMQETTVFTNDPCDGDNACAYSTTDKLYLAYAGGYGDSYITVGKNDPDNLNNGLRVDKGYWENSIWLRTPSSMGVYTLYAGSGGNVRNCEINSHYVVNPAFELKLSSVLFATAAKAAVYNIEIENGTITDDDSMVLRLDGSDKKMGTAGYDAKAGKIVAQKDADAAGIVCLVVQGKGKTNDWYYSVKIEESKVVSKEEIQRQCKISDIDFSACKIWLETTEDNVTYAKMADAKDLNAAATLEPGQTVIRADETISNSQDGTVTVDKEHDGTIDVMVRLPEAGNVHIAADGKITVPAGGTVEVAGGTELTLTNGGTVDADGNVEAEKIVSGDITLTVPEGGKVTADKDGNIMIPTGGKVEIGDGKELTLPTGGSIDKDGNITIPAGGKVETESGKELTLPTGGTIDKDGNIKAGKIISGDITVAAPEGEKLTADKAGNITVPAGGKVDKDENIKAEKIVSGDITVTAPEGENLTGDKAGDITVPAGGKVETERGKELTFPEGGMVDKDGNIKAEKIISGDITVTAPEGEKLTADKAGNITVPAGGKAETERGKELTFPEGGMVDKDGNIKAEKLISGDITVTAPEGEKLTADKTGNITVPAGGKAETESGKELTFPEGGMVDKDGNIKAEKITSGDITVTAPERENLTADKAGNITVPAGGKIETESGKELTLPEGGTVDKDGNIKAEKLISGDITVTAPEGENLTADKAGNITVPAGGKVETESGKELTFPEGGMVDKDGNIKAEKLISGDITITAPEGEKLTADKTGNIIVPAGGTAETESGKELTLPEGGTVDKDGNIKAEKIISGDITVTAPEGEKVTADKAGNIMIPAGGKVQTGDGSVTILPDGGMVDKDGNIIDQFFMGEGTSEDPYLIKTENDLKKLTELVNSGKDQTNAYYKIESEEGITLTQESRPWTPIGTAEHPFTGTFDGAGKTIKGLDISGSEPRDNQGLFGVNAGTIENLTVEGSVTGKDCVGGIAGKNDGIITGCTNRGSVTGSGTGVGGIVGVNGESGKVSDNVNSGNVVGGNTPTPTPGGSTPTPTPGGSTPTPTPGGNTPTPTPGGSTPTPTSGGGMSGLTPEQQKEVNLIAKELNIPVATAKKLQKMAQTLGIEIDTLLLNDQDILNQKSEGDVKGSSFSKIQAKATKVKKNRITVKWNKVKGADGYQIYAGKCGKNNKYKLVKTIKKASTTSFTYKKLKKGTGYKFIVKAYKNMDGKKYTVAASKNVHEATVGGKRANPKSVKVNKKAVKIRKGKKFTIKSKIVKASSGKKLLNHRKLSYESTNKKIATVSSKGVVRGKKAGTCYLYIYAENGVFKKMKVTVKK